MRRNGCGEGKGNRNRLLMQPVPPFGSLVVEHIWYELESKPCGSFGFFFIDLLVNIKSVTKKFLRLMHSVLKRIVDDMHM